MLSFQRSICVTSIREWFLSATDRITIHSFPLMMFSYNFKCPSLVLQSLNLCHGQGGMHKRKLAMWARSSTADFIQVTDTISRSQGCNSPSDLANLLICSV